MFKQTVIQLEVQDTNQNKAKLLLEKGESSDQAIQMKDNKHTLVTTMSRWIPELDFPGVLHINNDTYTRAQSNVSLLTCDILSTKKGNMWNVLFSDIQDGLTPLGYSTEELGVVYRNKNDKDAEEIIFKSIDGSFVVYKKRDPQ